MFDFNNIKKLFNYDFKNIIERTVPKDNKEKVDDKTTKDIISGAILKCGAEFLLTIVSILIVVIISNLASELFKSLDMFGITDNLSINVSTTGMISIAILIYAIIMKDKEQTSLLHFIVLIYCIVNSVSSLFGIIPWLISMIINPFIGIIGVIATLVNLLGNIFVIVGCLDFCCKTKSAYEKNNIDSKDKKSKDNNKCTSCGNKISSKDNFCKNCGNKIKR